ncbi:unnamed protein product [Caenorhabditis brenneri]
MNRRTLCILFVIVVCFSIAFSKEYNDLTAEEPEGSAAEVSKELEGSMKDSNKKGYGNAKNAAQTASFATVASIKEESGEEKKPDESATLVKGAPATDSFFTIGALTMAAIYIV